MPTLHPKHQVARLRIQRRCPRRSSTPQYRVHSAQTAAALGRARRKNGGLRMPKAVLFGELKTGKRNLGGPKKRYKDQLKKQSFLVNIERSSWQAEAADRLTWRSTVQKASREFEIQRSETAREKRQRQKERALRPNTVSLSETFTCPRCSRACASRIGLYGHQRACKPPTLP